MAASCNKSMHGGHASRAVICWLTRTFAQLLNLLVLFHGGACSGRHRAVAKLLTVAARVQDSLLPGIQLAPTTLHEWLRLLDRPVALSGGWTASGRPSA